MSKKFYVYTYTSQRDNIIVYVGKGKSRRYLSHLRSSTNVILRSKVNAGEKFIVDIVASDLTELDAFNLEISLISKYGRVCDDTGSLYNLTLGGEGASGYVYNEAEIIKRYPNRRIVTLENIKNGEIRTWQSMGLCARELKITRGNVHSLLEEKIMVLSNTWKLPGKVIEKNKTQKKSIAIKDLLENKIIQFKSHTEAAESIGYGKTHITQLIEKKCKHIARRYVLLETTKDEIDLIPRAGTCNKGRINKYAYKAVTVYDNQTNIYLTFPSRQECSKQLKLHSGDISSLIKGKLHCLKKRRYSITPL